MYIVDLLNDYYWRSLSALQEKSENMDIIDEMTVSNCHRDFNSDHVIRVILKDGNWTLRLQDISPTGHFAYDMDISPTRYVAANQTTRQA